MYETILYERSEDGIGILTINRPKALNALNEQVLSDMESIMTEIEQDDSLHALIITGQGRAFVAGADIVTQQPFMLHEGRKWGQRGTDLNRRIYKLEMPTIAAVNGFALGGGLELAVSCDIILAADTAKFGMPEVGLGIMPGFSGTQRLPRRIGVAQAKEMIFTGKMITAEEALEIGLVNHVYPADELMPSALDMAKTIVSKAPIAVKYAKTSINRGMQTDIDLAIQMENEFFGMCFATEDQKEGMMAFIEKRPAKFNDR